MRIRDWRITLLFLALCGMVEFSWAISNSPILTHKDQADEREFQNVYQSINAKPSISSGAGAPSSAPAKTGDIYTTGTGKVYIATATVTSASWVILN